MHESAPIDETHGKCAYCESKIKHIDYGDIEHILPKNKNARPDLCYFCTKSCEIDFRFSYNKAFGNK